MSKVRSLSTFFDRFKKDHEEQSDNDSANSADDRQYDEEDRTMSRATESLDQDIVSFFGDDFDDFGCQFILEDHPKLDHIMSFSSHAEGEGVMSPASKALSAISVLYGDDGVPVPREQSPPDLDIERNNSSLARFLQRAKSDVAETRSPASRSRTGTPRRHSCDVGVNDNVRQQEYQQPARKKKKASSVNNKITPLQTNFPAIEEELPELAVKVASFDFVVKTTANDHEDNEMPSVALKQTRSPPRRSRAGSTPRAAPGTTVSRSTPRSSSRSTPRSKSVDVDHAVEKHDKKSRSTPSTSKPSTCKPSSSSKHIVTEKHIRWCGHGVRWTAVALLAAIAGSVSSVLSQRSTAFVRLATPMAVAPIYQEVDTIGMFRMEVCFNETFSAEDQTGCSIFPLTSRDVSDNMFDLSRIFLTLATLFGCFFTLFLISAVFWESINLKPIGLGFLAIYFFQSFSMLFFDTEICSLHTCKLGPGCAYCIGASLCWILACVSVAKMDNFKIRAHRRRRRAARRARREERRRRYHELELKQQRMSASVTTRTVASLSTTSTSDSSSGLTPTSTCSDYDPMSPRTMKHTSTGSTGTGSVYEC